MNERFLNELPSKISKGMYYRLDTYEEINKEHERAIEEIIDNDFLNIYKKVERNKNKAG